MDTEVKQGEKPELEGASTGPKKARKAASADHRKKWTGNQMLADLKKFFQKNGRVPGKPDLRKENGLQSASVFDRHFSADGTGGVRKAMLIIWHELGIPHTEQTSFMEKFEEESKAEEEARKERVKKAEDKVKTAKEALSKAERNLRELSQ